MSANTASTFDFRGTRVYHGIAGGAVLPCRLVQREALTGKLIACATANRPIGVSPFTFALNDDMDYHRLGICNVETDGSAAIGDTVKAAGDGSGKAIKDVSPGGTPSVFAAGVLITLDSATNIGYVELFI